MDEAQDLQDPNNNEECEVVDRSFLDISSTETVESTANYVCNKCNKKFKYKSSLKRHFNKHSQQVKLSCGICNQYFSTDALKAQHNATCHSTRPLW